MGTSRRLGCLTLLVALPAGSALAQSPQEKQRGDILNELGLKKKPVPPPSEGSSTPPAGEPPPDGSEKTGAPDGAAGKQKGAGRGASVAAPGGPSFARAIHPQLLTTCKPCHSPVGPAAGTHLLFLGDPAADHHAVIRFVDVHNPEASPLLAKVSGTAIHAGGPLWPPTSAPYQRMLAWIRSGARLDAGGQVTSVAEPATPPAPAARRSPTTGAGGPPPSGAPEAITPVEEAPASEKPAAPETAAAPAAPAAAKPALSTFAATVHPLMMSACVVCHRPGGPAAMTRLLLSGDAARDEVAVRAFVDPQAPEQSLLLRKASGEMHGGGPVFPPGDSRLDTILAWVKGLAPAATAVPVPAPGVAAGAPPPPAIGAPTVPGASPGAYAGPPGHPASGGPPGLGLPFGFMLNGRFSIDYERRQFTGDPFAEGSVNALRSYHHFLFLSRDAAADPCGLSVEILTLQFWEAHCRVAPLPAPLGLTVAGGKIVVPFGADPLYHQNYGGLGGFDQPVLPVIWAIEGLAVHLVVERRALVLTDDLYVVRGYALPHADSIINLQSGFSAEDSAELGWGNRLGVAWMFASAWYSAYFNPLGFGRRLFMQAVDVTIWRPRRIPVLGHFTLGAGFIRADVSGGGAGVGGVGFDYYDFADYLQLRYYPTDWLYVQYRSGLRTFDNRRGIVIDNSRLTNADASTHNFAVVARYRGLTVGLYYFINLEKVDEIPNDLVRLSVIYDF